MCSSSNNRTTKRELDCCNSWRVLVECQWVDSPNWWVQTGLNDSVLRKWVKNPGCLDPTRVSIGSICRRTRATINWSRNSRTPSKKPTRSAKNKSKRSAKKCMYLIFNKVKEVSLFTVFFYTCSSVCRYYTLFWDFLFWLSSIHPVS